MGLDPIGRDMDAPAVTDLELRDTGGVAWIARGTVGPLGSNSLEVRKLEPGATASVLLDSGPGVDPGSLALSGATLYWTSAGAPRSAPLG